jgi:hypothetical protein
MQAVNPFPFRQLVRGDTLGYFTRDPIDYAIAIKTWTWLAHVEIYDGDGMSVASRNGIGVNRYPLRKDGLCVIRRPLQPFNYDTANAWFEKTARGQGYDWKGLLCFTLAEKQGSPDKMFCSEFWLNWYRQGHLELLDPNWSADRTPPAFMMVTNVLETIWQQGKGKS